MVASDANASDEATAVTTAGSDENLTVRELVRESELGLRLLAGEAALDRAVAGVHLSDLRDPTPWMIRGSVLLTTGPTLLADAETGLALLDALERIDAAALGIATGHHLEVVDPLLVGRAEELRLPLFEVPYGVPLRTIVAYVYDALGSRDLHRLRRTVAVQRHLLDLSVEIRSLDKLVTTVAGLLEMPVIVLDSGGNLVAGAGTDDAEALAARLWRSYARLRGPIGPLGVVETGTLRFFYREVELFGRIERVLAAASSHGATSEFVDTSLGFLQGLVALDLVRGRDDVLVRQRLRERLLRDLIAGREPPRSLVQRAAEQGLGPPPCWRVAVFAVKPPSRGRPAVGEERGGEFEDVLREAVDAGLSEQRLAYLSMPAGSTVTALLSPSGQGAAALGDLLANALARAESVLGEVQLVAGCSAPVAGVGEVATALHQAEEACRHASRGVRAGRVVLFEEMNARFRLLQGQDEAALEDLYERTIAPLAAYDRSRRTQLVATLAALLEHRFAPQATARALFIHRNTLQGRLERIERLLHVDLDDLDDVVELHLGLRAGELLGKPEVVRATRP